MQLNTPSPAARLQFMGAPLVLQQSRCDRTANVIDSMACCMVVRNVDGGGLDTTSVNFGFVQTPLYENRARPGAVTPTTPSRRVDIIVLAMQAALLMTLVVHTMLGAATRKFESANTRRHVKSTRHAAPIRRLIARCLMPSCHLTAQAIIGLDICCRPELGQSSQNRHRWFGLAS